MTLLRVECTSCHAVLQVRPELAGQQGKCPKCGSTIALRGAQPSAQPAAGETGAARPAGTPSLGQASAPDMLAEIFRRKKSAVMVVFETPASGSYELSRQGDANVRCYRTEDMSDAQLMQVLEHVGHMSQGKRNQKGGIGLQPDAEVMAFELKGDRLGTTLDDFKAKYARKIGSIAMPYTSESCPGQANAALWSEPWHVAAGLINARVDLPSEGNPPTIAGVKTELMLYHFVDGRLFRITVLFDTEAFHLIREAVVAKHGAPTSEIKEPMELAWTNAVSTIRLVRGMMRPKKASMLLVVHHDLQQSAEGRMPKRVDDL
jgi:predicted RNA-binding Zn-ribbon protein involved in translation (DUF1610 family)